MRRSIHATTLHIAAILVIVSFSGVQIASCQIELDSLVTGPYIDEVVFRVIPNQDQRIIALQSGEIEMDNSFIDPVHLPILNADPDISMFQGVRNGYDQFIINWFCNRDNLLRSIDYM